VSNNRTQKASYQNLDDKTQLPNPSNIETPITVTQAKQKTQKEIEEEEMML